MPYAHLELEELYASKGEQNMATMRVVRRREGVTVWPYARRGEQNIWLNGDLTPFFHVRKIKNVFEAGNPPDIIRKGQNPGMIKPEYLPCFELL
jgi:hypothetical protein